MAPRRGHTTERVILVSCGLLVHAVGMYLRTTQRRNKDGSVVRYVQLAHNRRMGKSTQAEVLVNLGREDHLDGEGLEVVASRPLGAAWLLDGLWRQLGVADALRAAVGGRRFTTDVERVLF